MLKPFLTIIKPADWSNLLFLFCKISDRLIQFKRNWGWNLPPPHPRLYCTKQYQSLRRVNFSFIFLIFETNFLLEARSYCMTRKSCPILNSGAKTSWTHRNKIGFVGRFQKDNLSIHTFFPLLFISNEIILSNAFHTSLFAFSGKTF